MRGTFLPVPEVFWGSTLGYPYLGQLPESWGSIVQEAGVKSRPCSAFKFWKKIEAFVFYTSLVEFHTLGEGKVLVRCAASECVDRALAACRKHANPS